MKKFVLGAVLTGVFLLTACGAVPGREPPSAPPNENAAVLSFVSGMDCSDPTCTDATHHHDCPADCTDYEHHHSCPLDCTEESHHPETRHEEGLSADTGAAAVTFVSGMGCSDPSCTDATHHHDCPADCTDYEHRHSGQADASHHEDQHEEHHGGGHH